MSINKGGVSSVGRIHACQARGHRFEPDTPLQFIVIKRKKENLFKVVSKENEKEFETLDLAMAHAKTLAVFVTIKGSEFEIVGMFGVDSIKDGLCPDGIAYDWNKASRIGRVKKERV
jgi:hypothetical protein